MHNKNAVKRASISILTSNSCLEYGLRTIGDELSYVCLDVAGNSVSAQEMPPLNFVIIDIEYIISQKRNWKEASLAIMNSDCYLFMSLSDGVVQNIPSILMNEPIAKIKQGLEHFLKHRSKDKYPLGQDVLLSLLTKSELNLIFYMGYGFSLQDIHERLDISIKALYSARTKVMKKLNLKGVKEVNDMLSFIEFLKFHENMHRIKENTMSKTTEMHNQRV